MDSMILPKTDKEGNSYLSYSQISTWKRSKREYIRQYFFGEAFEGNAYTDFGSMVGEALENDDYSEFTPTEVKFLKTVPRYDQFEREVKLNFGAFYVKGFIDTNTSKSDFEYNGVKIDEYVEKLADYKTGDIEKKKAEYESDEYNQLEIYALAIEQETGVLPTDARVYLIGRKGNAFKGEKLKLTKEFITITKEITKERVTEVYNDIIKVAEEISAYYQGFLTLNGLS